MEERSLKFVAEACAAEIRRGAAETLVKNVCTDSRQAKAGDLFFAIRGEKFDGYDFINEVTAKNVAAVVVEKSKVQSPKSKVVADVATLLVDDARIALGKLAAAYRTQFDLPMICVGGSNGKTTVKELLASVLRQKFSTLASEASFNNHIGVPLTLLRLEKSHQAAVLEAGTNHPGELAPLVKMIQPKFGVLTNIGREHLEFFGDVAGVAREEGWLAELLPADGKLFVNGDNEWTEKILARTKAKVVRVGLGEENDWRADKIRLDKNGVTFRVQTTKENFCGEYRINLLGRHQVTNALFAIAVGEELDLSRGEIQNGLAECKPPKMRLQFWEATVRPFRTTPTTRTRIRRLPRWKRCAICRCKAVAWRFSATWRNWAHSESAHAEVGRRAAELKIGQLFAVGKMAAVTAKAARDGGLNRVIEFENVEAAVTAIRKFLKTGDVVLLKASRASRLERIAETLKNEKT